ncbi:hypothetical protein F2P81_004375 [Scophthalmus maximus]|uniref:tRNA-uridine aminocarboxypropyltransferase 1 n=1 Tax=Scophthalmus maximus TaxID=52904 RepID=A0A6A4TF26_SCOMX|nr:hypothetical protein F2P81_004375 [Scophthalmus maximus]
MNRVGLPESGRHPWELTEAPSSCLVLLHYWTWIGTETTAVEPQRLQIKTLAEGEHTSDKSCHPLELIVCVVYSDCTPEQLAAIMNCSRHERHTRNYDYMEGGDVRIRQLFSRTQWFLTIDDRGNINGTQDPTDCYSILEIRTVSEGGILAIKGVKSQLYISMNKAGVVQGKLPVKIDIIKHPNETDGKSTAIHAKILAPSDVTIYTYPCIPDFDKDKRVVFIDSTWNQTNKISTDERLQDLLQVELRTRKTCFWRHQKGKPDSYLSTIEAIYYFLKDFHEHCLAQEYNGEYDNILFFYSYLHSVVNKAKISAGKC